MPPGAIVVFLCDYGTECKCHDLLAYFMPKSPCTSQLTRDHRVITAVKGDSTVYNKSHPQAITLYQINVQACACDSL